MIPANFRDSTIQRAMISVMAMSIRLDKELQELAEQYEAAMSENKPFYQDADELADLADWYGTKKRYDIQETGGPVYRCTLLPPDRAFVAECGFDRLMTEICAVLKLPSHE